MKCLIFAAILSMYSASAFSQEIFLCDKIITGQRYHATQAQCFIDNKNLIEQIPTSNNGYQGYGPCSEVTDIGWIAQGTNYYYEIGFVCKWSQQWGAVDGYCSPSSNTTNCN